MRQSRNLTRSVKELERIYEQVLEENVNPGPLPSEEGVSDEVQPSNSGPAGIENDIEEPVEVDETVKEMAHEVHEDKDADADYQDALKKEKESLKEEEPGMAKKERDRLAKEITDLAYKKKKKVNEDEKQNNENTEKTEKSTINNINMSNDNIFDKLYSTIMEADDELGDALDVGGLGGEEEGFDDLGDEGGEEVTVTLTPEQADALRAVVDQLGPDEGEAIEDLDGNGEEDFEAAFPEAVEAEHTSDGSSPGQDPSGHTGKNNKVGGTLNATPGSGSASADSSGEVDGGKPKSLPDTVSKMTNTGSNKVAGKVSGGNQGLLT